MKQNRIAKESFSKTTDDFLKKSINIILNSRINKLTEKETLYDQKYFALEYINFDFTEHFNDEYQELKPFESTKFYILDIFFIKDNVKFLVEKFTFKIELNDPQNKTGDIDYNYLIKKLSSFIRSIYSISRFLPVYQLKKTNSFVMFDYKFYSNKNLNNNFIEENYNKRSLSLDLDIAKIYLSTEYYLKEKIFVLEEKIKAKKIVEKLIPNSSSLNKRCRVLSEGCTMYNTHNTNQFEVFNYENTTINDNYFQKKYTTQLFSKERSKEKQLNNTQICDNFSKNRKNFLANRFDSCDLTKSHANNVSKNDYLSIISSNSSKEDKTSQDLIKAGVDNRKLSLKYLESNFSKKMIESDSSSVSSLDSFELEFEDSELKYNDLIEEKEILNSPLIIDQSFKVEDFILNIKNLKKQLNNGFLKINYKIIIKVMQLINSEHSKIELYYNVETTMK